ncbi:hypothetical protein PVAP13_5NG252400 [Panicum virgatum]|uniref:Uncharacterized protein n=1 Tax=Panicum virgatum TaxID=38727 RepID=A0A8T0RS80_PANVG|nr:hypothetical protein PVAP13_5NG252400 [Panicum virgatum]
MGSSMPVRQFLWQMNTGGLDSVAIQYPLRTVSHMLHRGHPRYRAVCPTSTCAPSPPPASSSSLASIPASAPPIGVSVSAALPRAHFGTMDSGHGRGGAPRHNLPVGHSAGRCLWIVKDSEAKLPAKRIELLRLVEGESKKGRSLFVSYPWCLRLLV